ncbi:hypothetical protein ACFOEY_18320 [Paracandidimonas soli]|uniref:hypothetical protein n=1 Tax=Paracandidimonas soli TaxID=1917182 RepID=UPI00360BC794
MTATAGSAPAHGGRPRMPAAPGTAPGAASGTNTGLPGGSAGQSGRENCNNGTVTPNGVPNNL